MKRPPNNARLETRTDGTLHVLQLTDFHNDVSDALTQQTYGDIRAIVADTKPDLLAVTGDIWCGDDKPEQGPALMERDLAFLGQLGIPWAFAWGNHDYVGDLDEALAKIAATPNAIAPSGDGRGSFRIEIAAPGTNTALWDLFFLNSGPEWNLPDDLEWFEHESAHIRQKRGSLTPAIVYVHIPLIEYEHARLEGRYHGQAHEEVLHWGDDGRVFQSFKQAQNVRACFVGHSHVNDFHCEVDSILLAYGRAIGHGGYGGDILPKGATLLVLDTANDRLTVETVFADGTCQTSVPFSSHSGR